MDFYYEFPAVKGIQAKHEYYISMVPLKYLLKLFPNDNDIVLPEFRAQRRINEARIPEIRNYILDNRESYVFSALSASIDGEFTFVENEVSNLGILKIDMGAKFLINDGQHRKAAIEEAIREDQSLKDETISIVFFRDEGLKRSQQMFTDLNKHAVKTSNSLSTLYDSRDELAVATKNVIKNVEFLKNYTDLERDILGKNSSKLFTLNTIYKANYRIIGEKQCENKDIEFLISYWDILTKNIVEWNELINKEITKKDLKENYILTLAVMMNAFGRLGRYFYENNNVDMEMYLSKLSSVNWLRINEADWQNRVIRDDGKIINNEKAVILACSKIKTLIGIELSREEKSKEQLMQGEYK